MPCDHGGWNGTVERGCALGGSCILFNSEIGTVDHAGACICADHLWGPGGQQAGWTQMCRTPCLTDRESVEDRMARCPWFGELGAMRDVQPAQLQLCFLWMLRCGIPERPPARRPVPTV